MFHAVSKKGASPGVGLSTDGEVMGMRQAINGSFSVADAAWTPSITCHNAISRVVPLVSPSLLVIQLLSTYFCPRWLS